MLVATGQGGEEWHRGSAEDSRALGEGWWCPFCHVYFAPMYKEAHVVVMADRCCSPVVPQVAPLFLAHTVTPLGLGCSQPLCLAHSHEPYAFFSPTWLLVVSNP